MVSPGQKLKIEKIEAPEGGDVSFDQVLLIGGEKTEVGTPTVEGARVEAKVLKQARARKLIVFKYRHKTRSRKKKGHRQHFTEVEIKDIKS